MDFELFFDPEEPDCPYLEEVASDELSIVTEETRKKGTENATKVNVGEAVKRQVIKAPWAAYFMALSKRFLTQLGVDGQHQRFFEKLPTERAHYSAQTFDHEIELDRWGWTEVAGFAYRTDYDLRKHMEATGEDLGVFKPYPTPLLRKVKSIRPNHQYIRKIFQEETGRVADLLSKDGLPRRATQVFEALIADELRVDYDESGSIGRRYARADEAGVPLGITIDYDTLKDDTVTVRDRDSWSQMRTPIGTLSSTIHTIVKEGFKPSK